MKALVYKSTGSWYDVKDEQGRAWKARTRGVLKIEGFTSTNPIAIGDWVDIEIENEDQSVATINDVFPRSNYISRQSPHNKNQHHIIASNLDQSLLIATLKDPRTSLGFIDRFLIASEAHHLPAIIVFNKKDSWKKKEWIQFEFISKIYEQIGYRVIAISVLQKKGLETIEALLSNKTTLLSGHSGVGKSSFLNLVLPGLDINTREVSEWSGKGMHTTTFAQMFDLPGGGHVIDTPGLREFGIVHISRQELSHYFPEMRDALQHCQFNNCMHISEPGCAVRPPENEAEHEAFAINPVRYVSYLNILETMTDKKW